MKKLIYLIVIIVAFGLIIPGCIPVVPSTEQSNIGNLTKADITVLSGGSIQAAIDAASPGETINVEPGTYNEAITVNKSLTIQSTGTAANTIIDASNTLYPPPYMYAVTITANDVTFQGFTVRYNWLYGMKFGGISLDSVSGCTISDNIGDVGLEGIYLKHSSANAISGNDFSNNNVDDGIYLYYSDGNEIVGNDVSSVINGFGNPGIGIFVYYSDNNEIHGNTANSDDKGILIKLTSHGNKVYENEVSGNSRGIDLDNAYENEIYNNNAISGNSIGIIVENSPDNEIYGNLITGNSQGIYLFWGFGTHTSGNNIYNNDITSNSDIGIKLSGTNCHDNPIHYNNITGNTNWGVNNLTGGNVVDAENNWWGDPSGPYHTTLNTTGTGDAVSDNVEFCPWALDNAFTNFITLTLSPLPQPEGFDVYLEATLNNSTSNVSIYFVINGSTHTGFTDGNGIAEVNAGPLGVGVYNVSASVMSMPEECLHAEALLAVYDPTAGFVTGGGWINSPVGASSLYPLAEGKAIFGFVSKYKKGQSEPTGNTEFQFKAGDLNFHSDSYDWLVITGGQKAMYKGTGTVNGADNFGFMLSAIDDDPDMFRIKIWDKVTDTVIYDNKVDEVDDEDGTVVAGGQIVIHKAK